MRYSLLVISFFACLLGKAQNFVSDTLIANGEYVNNLPEGDWTFTKKALRRDEITKLIDYRYVTTLSGLEDNIIGQFRGGIPQGQWEINRVRIMNSIVSDTTFKSSINYENGIPQLSVKMEGEQKSLVARFLRDGFAHDQWTLFEEEELEQQEEWTFDNGLLVEVKINGEEPRTHFDPESASVEMPMSRKYFTILELEDKAFTSSGIIKLFSVQGEVLEEVENAFKDATNPILLRKFMVRVPKVKVRSEDKKMLESIAERAEEAQRITNGILSNSQLNIAKLSDPETSYQFNTVERLHELFVVPLTKLEYYTKTGITNHVKMKKVLPSVFPRGIPSTSFQVNVANADPRNYDGELGFSDNTLPTLANIQKLANFILSELAVLRRKLSEKASIEIREKSIVTEEVLLVDKAQDFKLLIEALKSTSSEQAVGVLDHIYVFSEKELTEYSKMEDSAEKLNKAKSLEDCYEDLTTLSAAVGGLMERKDELEDVYKDEVWNPFTSTLMDERVKRRIMGAYEEVLVPHTLALIKNNLSCENALSYEKKFDVLYERMIVLRDMKTKKLERKLKRKKDPEEILSILGVENF